MLTTEPKISWRTAFPTMANLDAKGITYLDNAATTQKLGTLMQAHHAIWASGIANPLRGLYDLSHRLTEEMEMVRADWADWLNCSADELGFTMGTTPTINGLCNSLLPLIKPHHRLVVSSLEHAANTLPWQRLAELTGAELVFLPLDHQNDIDVQAAKHIINEQTQWVALTQLSNVTGRSSNLTELIAWSRLQGAAVMIDGAQGFAHIKTDVKALDCDIYVCSLHKCYGPEGTGLLYMTPYWRDRLQAWVLGGGMFEMTNLQKFEAGSLNVSSLIASRALLNFWRHGAFKKQQDHIDQLLNVTLRQLHQRDAFLIAEPHHALVSFVMPGWHTYDLGVLLAESGICIRIGEHCAQTLMQSNDIQSWIRLSLAAYNNEGDLERFFEVLDTHL